MKKAVTTILELLVIPFMVLVLIGGWVIKSHFEKKAFNKFSEEKATLTDAMFSNLRITTK